VATLALKLEYGNRHSVDVTTLEPEPCHRRSKMGRAAQSSLDVTAAAESVVVVAM
jgi:hypothetical protein